ncbi:hypothetical protein [Mycobacterium sp.]|uniref:hypothetical protein n=1 Tax=Mycobacterium sp. TaxID=1785 RepID=UPI003BB0E151
MKKTLIAAVTIGAGLTFAAPAHAQPAPGEQCQNWHATAPDSNGQTLTCTHLPDSGHLMYWEYGGAKDSAYQTYKDDPPMTSPAVRPGVPCDSRAPHVLTVDPATGNAIHPYGPPGCDRSLPVIGGDQ